MLNFQRVSQWARLSAQLHGVKVVNQRNIPAMRRHCARPGSALTWARKVGRSTEKQWDSTNPDAPCMEYLPTFTLKVSKNYPNVGKYSTHGASGQQKWELMVYEHSNDLRKNKKKQKKKFGGFPSHEDTPKFKSNILRCVGNMCIPNDDGMDVATWIWKHTGDVIHSGGKTAN